MFYHRHDFINGKGAGILELRDALFSRRCIGHILPHLPPTIPSIGLKVAL